jgi:TLC domain
VSTAFLCALACFDAKRGIAPLAKTFPMLMKAIGGAFAVLFVVFRVVLWPYFCYFFWIDSLELLRTGTAHSIPILYLFMFVNTALTFLQIFWLREIYVTALKVFSGDGDLSIERGSEKKKL